MLANAKAEAVGARRPDCVVIGANQVLALEGEIGWPVAHSRSPLIHGYWLKNYAVCGRYVRRAVPPEGIADFLAGMRALGRPAPPQGGIPGAPPPLGETAPRRPDQRRLARPAPMA